jgi:hypothetical protein
VKLPFRPKKFWVKFLSWNFQIQRLIQKQWAEH